MRKIKMNEFEFGMKQYCTLIDNRLNELLTRQTCLQQVVFDAMKYSVEAGGKRIRPILMLEFCKMCGGNYLDALDFACALEMIHTYSLIHDDLPCMDNDDMRRGKPSCHKAFGEANALLAGDALLNLAFETMLSAKTNASAENIIKTSHYISKCSGADGMIGGQVIDLKNEGKDISEEILLRLYNDKTAALLRAAVVSGVILADGSQEYISLAEKYAENLGLAFQIVDDILDCIGDQDELGKPIGSDEKNNKKTYISFHGLENAKTMAKTLTENALKILDNFENNAFLKELTLYLCDRKK